MHKFLPLLFVALFALPANAQFDITLSGTVEAAPADPCNPNATHRLRCSEILLQSSTVDLAARQGRISNLTGRLIPALGCVTLEVTAAEDAAVRTTTTAIFGYRLGRPVLFTTFAPPGSTILYLFSGGTTFLPLGPLGALMLDSQSLAFVGYRPTIGIDIYTETLPTDPAFVGVDIYHQFGYFSILNGLEGGLMNIGCFQIQQ